MMAKIKKIRLPNGKPYRVSEKKWENDWNTAETIQAHWCDIKKSFKDSPAFPDGLPAQTKFYRSRATKDGVFIKIPGFPKYWISTDVLPDSIKTKIAPLTLKHSFKLLPVSNEPSAPLALYALQHEDKKSKYLDVKYANDKKSETLSRVKFAIPKNVNDNPSDPGNKIRVYKTKKRALPDLQQWPTTDLRIGDPSFCEDSKKTTILMEFGGRKNLLKAINNESFSLKKMTLLARQCCEAVEKLHKEKFILRDIKPENFILSDDLEKVSLIDIEESIIAEDDLGDSRLVSIVGTPGFYIETHPSQQSDMYGLGVTLGQLASKESHLHGLAALMGRKEAKERFTITETMQWFSLLESSSGLIEGITAYYKPYTVVPSVEGSFFEGDEISCREEKKRRENIHAFFAFLETRKNDTSVPALSIFQLEAMACLFKHFPEMIESKNWKKLCTQDVEPALVCTLAGVGEYLDSPRGSYANSAGGEGAVRSLVLTLLTKENITPQSISAAIVIANDSTKPSKNKPQSRKTIFEKYQHIAEAIVNNDAQWNGQKSAAGQREKTQQALLLLGKHFPHLNAYHHKITHDPNALLAKIIVKSVAYLESDSAGWLGKRSIKNLVNDLLTNRKLVQNAAPALAQSIMAKKLKKHSEQYKFKSLRGWFSRKAPNENVKKKESRTDIFAEEIEMLKRTPNQ